MEEVELVAIPKSLLLQLLKKEEQLHIITGIFKIPNARSGEAWVGKEVTERIRTYITSYIMRKSVFEKETGAAFSETVNPLISDPLLDHENKA